MAPCTSTAALGSIVGLAVEDITGVAHIREISALQANAGAAVVHGRHHLQVGRGGQGGEQESTKQRRVVSVSELEQHRTEEDAWILVDGRVYDITPFLETHPGGIDVILEQLHAKDVGDLMRGQEASRKPGFLGKLSFESGAPNEELHSHSKAAFRMLQQFLVGELEPDTNSDTGSDTNLWSHPTVTRPDASRKQAQDGGADGQAAFEVDLSRPIVCQVGRLGNSYNSWVHDPVISKEIPRFFESDLLEFFTQTKWWAVPLVWIPAIIALVVYGLYHGLPRKAVLPSVLLGLFVWTLLEYFLHRFVFHMQTSSYWGNTLHYVIHGFHHKHPMDGSRLVFPPLFSFVIVTILWVTIGMLRIPRGIGAAGLGGAILGYVCYDLTHYFLHFGAAFNETSRQMKRYHLNHHFKVQSEGFGVMTWTMWDRVFGTLPGAEREDISSRNKVM